MDLGNFERAVGARELFSRLQEKEVSLCADPRAAGFFMRALETNEHNFAALTNIVYCNQKVRLLSYERSWARSYSHLTRSAQMYNWQDYDHFIALLDQAHQVYDQLLHPFHAAAYPVSGERFKDLAVSYASHTLALVHPKFRLSHRDQSNETGTGRIRCVVSFVAKPRECAA